MYRSLLKLPTKEIGLPAGTTFTAICRIIVDETFRLPRPLLAGQVVTRCDRPDIAHAAIAGPQVACLFSKCVEDPTDCSFVKQNHHTR